MRRMFETKTPQERLEATVSRLHRERVAAGIMEAFGHGVITRTALYPAEDAADVAGLYVDTVNANIAYFLRDKPHRMAIDLGAARSGFARFWQRIGAAGHLDAAISEFDTVHNACRSQKG